MDNQQIKQGILVSDTQFNKNKAAEKLALFLEDGSPLDLDTLGQTPWESDIDAAGFELKNLHDPTSAQSAATMAYVLAQIAALVNSAPGALNTLKELADALNDDANFAASMTTALAGKQPLDTDLSSIAGLSSAANKGLYATGSGVWSLYDLTAAARTLLDDPDVSTMRATLGLQIGQDVAPAVRTVGSGLATTGTINLDMTGLHGTIQTIALTGNPTFTTSNRAAGREVTIILSAGGGTRSLAFPGWIFVGAAAPTSLASGKSAVITVTFTDNTDAAAIAAYSAQP